MGTSCEVARRLLPKRPEFNKSLFQTVLYLGFAALVGLATTNPAHAAGLTLTPAGVADGFGLSVFASGISNNTAYGPMGSTTTSSGNVLVTDYGGSPPSTFSWTDVDGQTPGSALADSSIGIGYFGITNSGGKIYAVNFGTGTIDLLNNDGSFNSVFLPLPSALGITTNPVDGHIYVDSGSGIKDIDPVTKAIRIVNNVSGDGITVSPDGSTVYLALANSVAGFNTTTGAPTGFVVNIPGADGVAVIENGIFYGYLVVNSNNGIVDLVNPATSAVTTIASGGSRGDFVGYDYTNGTAFLSQTSSVDRLSCGAGCLFTGSLLTVAPGQCVPFPVTLAASAGPNGAYVTLTSSDASKLTFENNLNPIIVFFPPGSTTSSRRMPQVCGVNFGSATITSFGGTLSPAPPPIAVTAALSFAPASVTITKGTQERFTLILSGLAPAGGLTVNLSSGNVAVATVPATVTIPANSSSVVVPVTAVGSGSTLIHASNLPFVPDTTASVTVP